MLRLLRSFSVCAVALSTLVANAQTGSRISIGKIDPPNWFAALPKPMLLVRGEHLDGATFTLSDPTLRLERTSVSANGHWAQLWLAASPDRSETIQIRASSPAGTAEAPYTFAPRNPRQPSGFS